MADIQPYGALPGTGSLQASQEAQVWVGRDGSQEFGAVALAAATTDAGNSTTTLLRPGLILGRITATGLYTNYSATATDGSEVACAVLNVGTNMLDSSGATKITQAFIVSKGILQPDFLIGLDFLARRQMVLSGKFIFSDDIQGRYSFLGGSMSEKNITANTTLTSADSGKLVTNVGANVDITVTLPAVNTNGVTIEFLNQANQSLTISSAEGANIVYDNTLIANSIAFSTANHKIGGRAILSTNAAATKWTVKILSTNTVTAG